MAAHSGNATPARATQTQEQPLLDVQNLSVDYVTQGRAPAHALVDISFQLRRGEVMGLVGESGCGT